MEIQANIFSNEDITVTYEPRLCIHAEKCAKGLSNVFRTDVLPWINLDAGETQKIIQQIKLLNWRIAWCVFFKTFLQILINSCVSLKSSGRLCRKAALALPL